MKKVVFDNGFPLVFQPFAELQNAILNGFEGFASGLGNCILSGCVIGPIDGSFYPVSAGWVLLNGEVLRVPAHTIGVPLLGDIRVLYKTNVNPVNYPVAHATSEVKQMLSEDVALIKNATAPGSGEAAYLTTPDFATRLRTLAESKAPTYTVINAYTNGYAAIDGDVKKIGCRKIDGRVELSGVITRSSIGAVNQAAFTLPVGFRPPASIRRVSMAVRGFVSGVQKVVPANILPSGEVFIVDPGNSLANELFWFDGCSFSI